MESYSYLLRFMILTPLLGAAILGLFGKRLSERAIGLIACSTVGISAVLSVFLFFADLHRLEHCAQIYDRLFTWISVGSFPADASLLLDSLSPISVVFLTFVALLIH